MSACAYIWIAKWSQTIVFLLSGRIPQQQVVVHAVNGEFAIMIGEHGRHIYQRERIPFERDDQAGFAHHSVT